MGCGASSQVKIVNSKGLRTAAEILFQRYDKNNSGKLNEKEFRQLCRDLGYHLTQEEVDLDMKLLDLNGDGRIGYHEFIKWWKSENRFQKLQWGPERLKLIHELSEKFAQYSYCLM